MPETVMHRIDSAGQRIECHAPAEAFCRKRPQCTTDTWHGNLCDDHNPGHPVLAGQDCWMSEWVNASFLTDCAEKGDPVLAGAAVELTFHGADIGVTWRLHKQ